MLNLLTNKYVLGALALVALLATGAAYVRAKQNAAVEQERLEQVARDLAAERDEYRRQWLAAETALTNEQERAEQRDYEDHLLRVEIDGYTADIASGIAVACPSDDAYTDRMRALWSLDGGGDQPAAHAVNAD